MNRRKIAKIAMIVAGGVLAIEVIVLHVNQVPIELTPLRVERWTDGGAEVTQYSPALYCRLYNPRLTPIRYYALSNSMVEYRVESLGRHDKSSEEHYDFYNSWCTAHDGFTLPPRSSREVWMWIPDAPQELNATIYYKDTSLFSWFSPFYREFHNGGEAMTTVNLKELEEIKKMIPSEL